MKQFLDGNSANYRQLQTIDNRRYVCGFCSHKVSSDRGFKIGVHGDASGAQLGGIYVCPNCYGPTFAAPDGESYPSAPLGSAVAHRRKWKPYTRKHGGARRRTALRQRYFFAEKS